MQGRYQQPPEMSLAEDTNSINSLSLSRHHQSILDRMKTERQRFVTGKDPIIVSIKENPTWKWLMLGRPNGSNERKGGAAACEILVNGTTLERSLASFERFQWLDKDELVEFHESVALVSVEFLGVINVAKPGYVSVMPGDGAGASSRVLRYMQSTNQFDRWKRNSNLLNDIEEELSQDVVWSSGFSLTSGQGILHSIDTRTGAMETMNSRTRSALKWPNEINSVPSQLLNLKAKSSSNCFDQHYDPTNSMQDAMLVSDGFLVPGKDDGGIYIVLNPGNPSKEWTACLSERKSFDKWFYHRAVWVDLTGDGRKSILTARAKFPLGSSKPVSENARAQLVWLEMPKPPRVDELSGTPLEEDGTIFDPFSPEHLPWKERVLEEGPDVMFCVADLDTTDDTIEVLSSQFFGKKVSLHSIRCGPKPKVVFQRTIDDKCGSAFGATLANLDCNGRPSHLETRKAVDSGSTVACVYPGESFSHLLVTSHEGNSVDEDSIRSHATKKQNNGSADHEAGQEVLSDPPLDGGSLFAYRVPQGKENWKFDTWHRTVVASGFKVQTQIGNMINPGAPGFAYVFYANKRDAIMKKKRPLIAVAGDCAESAFIFRPDNNPNENEYDGVDGNAQYKLMCEVQCDGTVGSIGVGYDDFCSVPQESGYAKLYIPCYEKDKIYVFALGSGEDEVEDEDW